MDSARRTIEELIPQNIHSPNDITKLISDYYDNRFKDEERAANFMDQTAKGFFNLILKLSYTIFAFGIALTIKSGIGIDQQKVIVFVGDARGKSFLITLAILGFIIISIEKVIKEDSELPAISNKQFNFFSDILTLAFYIISLVFVGPFVFQNSDQTLLIISFWLFSFALTLFFIRKVVKWKFFYFDEKGKYILDPWKNSVEYKKDTVSLIADVVMNLQILKKDIEKPGANFSQINSNIGVIPPQLNPNTGAIPLQPNPNTGVLSDHPQLNPNMGALFDKLAQAQNIIDSIKTMIERQQT